ncbi:MAG: hypothetical protein PQJ59_16720 [Spirochaetales bacterium]|nr:hypothetical protein [Spirochaetales bacterium]
MEKNVYLYLPPFQVERLKVAPLPFQLGDDIIQVGEVRRIVKKLTDRAYLCNVFIYPQYEEFAERELMKIEKERRNGSSYT